MEGRNDTGMLEPLGSSLETLDALDLAQVCIRNLDGRIRFWSRGNERLYGWSRKEAAGEISHHLLQTKFPKPLPEIEADLLTAGQWEGELQHRTKRGDVIWVASNWVLQRGRTGTEAVVVEVNNDVTGRRQSAEDKAYLAAIVSSSDDAIISKNLNGVVTSWNSAAERIFGYTAPETVGKPITILFPPELVMEEADILRRLHRGERIEHYETVRVTKSGRRIFVSATISPIYDADGNLIGASKIVKDISSRKEMEETLRATERQRRLAVEAGELGLWSYRVSDGCLDWGPVCKTIFGLATDAATPDYATAIDMIHHDDRAQVHECFQTAIAGTRAFDLEYRIIRLDGRVRWVKAKGRPFLNDQGQVAQVHGTIMDFTARKQKEEALIRANEELLRFAYAAAHDLQEPLRNVALSVELAKRQLDGELNGPQQALLNGAIGNAQKMEAMVRDLLAYTKVLGAESEDWPVVDASTVLNEALANLRASMQDVSGEVIAEVLPSVRMQRIHLLQVFQNLVSNSLKYRGTRAPVVKVAARAHPGMVQFSLKDNGIGIEQQYHERVFGVFKRLRDKDAPGTGVGLALCKRVVEHYGGNIWIDSVKGEGATFHFTVPAATDADFQ